MELAEAQQMVACQFLLGEEIPWRLLPLEPVVDERILLNVVSPRCTKVSGETFFSCIVR